MQLKHFSSDHMDANKAVQSIVGCGSYLPGEAISNSQLLERGIDSSDDWIQQRTGIHYRHFADKNISTVDLAYEASKNALADANMTSSMIDMIVLATTTPDHVFPATAAKLQAMLGVSSGAAFDVQAVCAGFVFALQCASNAIAMKQANNVLVVGAELYSRILDWQDRGTCVLFGDGAGAIVLSNRGDDSNYASDITRKGVLSTHLMSDGRHYKKLYVDGGVGSTASLGHVRMQGQEVFKFAVNSMASIVDVALQHNGYDVSDLDWLVPHQANKRIIDKVGQKLGLNEERVIVTVDRHANTSAATIPIALDIAKKDGRLKPNDLIALSAMGGGFSWGSALIRW